MLIAGTYCKAPEEWDVYLDQSQEKTVGPFFVVIRHPKTKELAGFPLRFLEDTGYDVDRCSCLELPTSIMPVGKIEHKFVLKMT